MDNWMAPRAFATAGGNNGKLARQSKAAAAQAAAQGGGSEESGVAAVGMLKRKRTSPPGSPAPSKKRVPEEEAEHQWPMSSTADPSEVPGAEKGQAGKSRSIPEDSRVSKQFVGHEAIASVFAAEEVARSGIEKDGDDPKTRVTTSVENISHGQGTSFQCRRPSETSGPAISGTIVESSARPGARSHRVPSHAGWFQWTGVHHLEKLGLPEYFNGKNNLKTPETYMEQRNCIIMKYRENPQKLLKLEDVQGLLRGDVSGAARVFGFLDHWGLINYQAISVFSPFPSSGGTLGSVEEIKNGALQLNPLTKPALTNLFQFENVVAPPPAPKLLSAPPASSLPLSSLAEALVQESLAAPSVEYHCNSCQADCSKRRYHCQKQADFDLCPDCYSDGKFGQGMTSADFLRMDALADTVEVNGGGWSDQETLLLLEALELYGENWNEIAEHVATKSKAQCILHFIRLPIEDPFLEDMEAPNPGIAAQSPCTPVTDANGTTSANDKALQPEIPYNVNSPSVEAKDALSGNPGHDVSVPVQKGNDMSSEMQITDKNMVTVKTETGKDVSVVKISGRTEVEESSVARVLLEAAENAGFGGSDGLIAFADAGNPVMAQVAFLAAMVGPRVAAAAAQAALKSLAEEDPVGFLSTRNSFALDFSDRKDGILVPGSSERLTGQQSAQNESASTGGATESLDTKGALTTEEGRKDQALSKTTGTVDDAGGGCGQTPKESEENILTGTSVAEGDRPSIARVRDAAACALASAAVKAKLLADQEEREIQRLVAGVIENQLKKLELKLKHFNELETMLGKECEQAEKARAKVYAERARIVASRLSSTPPTNQIQSSSTPLAPYTKTPAQQSNNATQSKPAVFTFGPTGVSAPATGFKTSAGPETVTSLPAGASSQQGLVSQRVPRPTPGPSLTSGVK